MLGHIWEAFTYLNMLVEENFLKQIVKLLAHNQTSSEKKKKKKAYVEITANSYWDEYYIFLAF